VLGLRRIATVTCVVLLVGGTNACTAGPGPRPNADPNAAAELAARLGDADLVGQVLMPYAYGNDASNVSSASAAANRAYAGVSTPAEMVAKYRLGGLILVGTSADQTGAGTSNVESAAQVRVLTTGLQAQAGRLPAQVPMLIATDQEHGVVTRVRTGVTLLPGALAFGAAADPALTEAAWRATGAELAAMGITVDFAPVADVLGEDGGFIGSRSFGSAPDAVSVQVSAAVRGLRSSGVAATLKHFPGHGHTITDSHEQLPVLPQSREALGTDDLPPFVAGIGAGADLVMVGHLDVRAIDPGVAASFSSKVMIDLLRGQLGFRGVVVSDALNMAPARRYPAGEAAVLAMLAGTDLLLEPPDLAAAQQGLLDALRSGRLPRARLIEAVTRILSLKLRLSGTPQPAMSTVDTAEHRATAAAVAGASVTVLRGACSGPLLSGPVTVTSSGRADQQQARTWLTDALQARGVSVVPKAGTVVHLIGYRDEATDLSPDAAVTVAIDVPYLLRSARSPTLLATYSSTRASMTALAAVLTGAAPAPGRSPVTVTGLPRSACG